MLGDDTFTIAYTAVTHGGDRNPLYLAQPDLDADHHGHTRSRDLIDAFTDAIGRSEAKVAAIDQPWGWGIESPDAGSTSEERAAPEALGRQPASRRRTSATSAARRSTSARPSSLATAAR